MPDVMYIYIWKRVVLTIVSCIQKTKITHKSIVNFKCYLQDGENKITYIILPCKEDKITILEFAVKILLANQDYQALSLNFDLYMNDPEKDKLMELIKEISKYFDKPLVLN